MLPGSLSERGGSICMLPGELIWEGVAPPHKGMTQ